MGPALPLVKLGIGVVAGIPVSKVLGDVIKNNVTVVTKSDAVKVKFGGWILTTMLAGALSRTTDTIVNNVIETYTTVRNRKKDPDSPSEDVVPEETP